MGEARSPGVGGQKKSCPRKKGMERAGSQVCSPMVIKKYIPDVTTRNTKVVIYTESERAEKKGMSIL